LTNLVKKPPIQSVATFEADNVPTAIGNIAYCEFA